MKSSLHPAEKTHKHSTVYSVKVHQIQSAMLLVTLALLLSPPSAREG